MNEENKPNYYAIIPAEVRYDKKLKDKAKLLYGEISALCNKDGTCFASNNYFAELYGIRKETISRLIACLEEQGYILVKVERDEETNQVKRRLIYLLTKTSIPLLIEKSRGHDKKINTPIDEKVKENNTDNNNTINILIDFYNRTNKFPKVLKVTDSRKKKINARLKDVGYDNLVKAIQIATESDFLTGKVSGSSWIADFDWFVDNDTNAFKVIEGKYNTKDINDVSNKNQGINYERA